MEIADSARKHGISDEAMQHAERHRIRSFDQDDGLTLSIGFDQAGQLLEIVVLDDDPAEEPVIIHAMPARRKFTDRL